MAKHSSTAATRPRFRRSVAVVVLVALATGGAVAASAASLGGLPNIQKDSSSSTAASCDTNGVTTAYGTGYVPSTNTWNVTSVTVSGIAAGCAGQNISVAVSNGTTAGSGTAVADASGTKLVPLSTPAPGYDGTAVTNISVVIAQ